MAAEDLICLAYPAFESDPHPALRHAITIDLAAGKARHTDYADNPNPPILHRKELISRSSDRAIGSSTELESFPHCTYPCRA